MSEVLCRFFNGYKPCGLNDSCTASCPKRSLIKSRILVVHLEALGAVLRTTSILKALRRKHPQAYVTWVTQKPANALLENNPYIDQVLTTESGDLLKLSALEFDVAYCVDKSFKSYGVIKQTKVKKLYGFEVDPKSFAIIPANEAAKELWELGLSNEKKFFENQKPETQLMVEALELGHYKKDPYVVQLTEEERSKAQLRRWQWGRGHQIRVGINTGCSPTIPYKKLSVEGHRELIKRLKEIPNISIVLLGGREDKEANEKIAEGLSVVCSPTEYGLRDGFCSVEACDIVVSGDSLGMHMAIALKKWVVAWFGPTCHQEIELYDRGVKVLSSVPCTPCWKRNCQKSVMCYDLVDLNLIVNAVKKGIEEYSYPKLLSPEFGDLTAP